MDDLPLFAPMNRLMSRNCQFLGLLFSQDAEGSSSEIIALLTVGLCSQDSQWTLFKMILCATLNNCWAISDSPLVYTF